MYCFILSKPKRITYGEPLTKEIFLHNELKEQTHIVRRKIFFAFGKTVKTTFFLWNETINLNFL